MFQSQISFRSLLPNSAITRRHVRIRTYQVPSPFLVTFTDLCFLNHRGDQST